MDMRLWSEEGGVVSALVAEGSARRSTAAFEAELRPLLRPAVRLATGMLADAFEAEDAVQEAALQAWRRSGNRRPDTELGPWFLAIVANRCRERRRQSWIRVARVAELVPAPGASADHEVSLDVRAALRSMPYDARLALVLRYYLELPFEEVAAVLACSVEAARSRVRRAAVQITPSVHLAEEGLA
jgi:RNA polymerase sigma-70 factor (ECF subfamily)